MLVCLGHDLFVCFVLVPIHGTHEMNWNLSEKLSLFIKTGNENDKRHFSMNFIPKITLVVYFHSKSKQ